MTMRPILFSGPMVLAILEGMKTQTRRIMRPQPHEDFLPRVGIHRPTVMSRDGEAVPGPAQYGASDENESHRCPFGEPGNYLWVRESCKLNSTLANIRVTYRADSEARYRDHAAAVGCFFNDTRWRPSIHMPQWASRLLLKIEAIRCERLTEIRESGARREGVEPIPRPEFGDRHWRNYGPPALINVGTHAEREVHHSTAWHSFASLWRSIHGAESWNANPWVWVVEFEVAS